MNALRRNRSCGRRCDRRMSRSNALLCTVTEIRSLKKAAVDGRPGLPDVPRINYVKLAIDRFSCQLNASKSQPVSHWPDLKSDRFHNLHKALARFNSLCANKLEKTVVIETQSRRNIGDNAANQPPIPPAGEPIIILCARSCWRGGDIAIPRAAPCL
jgi:hypothetical protein